MSGFIYYVKIAARRGGIIMKEEARYVQYYARDPSNQTRTDGWSAW